MNNAVFGKAMESVTKNKDIILVTTQRRRNYLVPGQNFHTKFFTEKLLAIHIKKTEILMNKPVYLRLSILTKILMYEFSYDYIKPKYRIKQSCVIWIPALNIYKHDIYKDISEDVEARFDTSNYELDRPQTKGKNKKVI